MLRKEGQENKQWVGVERESTLSTEGKILHSPSNLCTRFPFREGT